MNPDAGNYEEWSGDVERVIARYSGELQQSGCVMALEKRLDYFICIDVDPNAKMIEFDGTSPKRVRGDSSSYVSPFQSMPSDLAKLESN